jgi:hypothetical protein
MKLEIISLCDAATADQSGKLNILGSFDSLFASQLPITHPACAVALRIRFEAADEGNRVIELRLADSDGKQLLQPVKANIQVPSGADPRALVRNFVLNFQQLKLTKFGEYTIDLLFDSRPVASIPLYAIQTQPQPQQQGR